VGKWGRIAARGPCVACCGGEKRPPYRCLTRPWSSRKPCSSTIANATTTTATPFTFTMEPPWRRRECLADVSEWNLRPDNYVLFLGRFSPEKNCHLLIEALRIYHTDMKLVLAGGSSHRWYVKSLSRTNRRGCVFSRGSRGAIWRNFSAMQRCSCFRRNLRGCRWRYWMPWRRAYAC